MKRHSGFTLVEVLFAIVIIPILFLSIYGVLHSANIVFQTNNVFSRLNQNAMQSLRYISREIGQTSPNVSPSHLTIVPDGANSMVTFQIPVDRDNDGDVVDNQDNVEWGAYREAGQVQNGLLGSWTRYRVVGTQLRRQVLNGALAPMAGLDRVVANDVQSFTVVQNLSNLRMTLTLQGTDNVGQSGGTRTLTSTFTSETTLRNAVN